MFLRKQQNPFQWTIYQWHLSFNFLNYEILNAPINNPQSSEWTTRQYGTSRTECPAGRWHICRTRRTMQCKIISSGKLCPVACSKLSEVSEKSITSIFSCEENSKPERTWMSHLSSLRLWIISLHSTRRRRTAPHKHCREPQIVRRTFALRDSNFIYTPDNATEDVLLDTSRPKQHHHSVHLQFCYIPAEITCLIKLSFSYPVCPFLS